MVFRQLDNKPTTKNADASSTSETPPIQQLQNSRISSQLREALDNPNALFALHTDTPRLRFDFRGNNGIDAVIWSTEDGKYMRSSYDQTTGSYSDSEISEDEFVQLMRQSGSGVLVRHIPSTISPELSLKLGNLADLVPVFTNSSNTAETQGNLEILNPLTQQDTGTATAATSTGWQIQNVNAVDQGQALSCVFQSTSIAINSTIHLSITGEQLLAAIGNNMSSVIDSVKTIRTDVGRLLHGELPLSSVGFQFFTGGICLDAMQEGLKENYNINSTLSVLNVDNPDNFVVQLAQTLQNGPLIFTYNAYDSSLYSKIHEELFRQSGVVPPTQSSLNSNTGGMAASSSEFSDWLNTNLASLSVPHGAVMTGIDIVRNADGRIDGERTMITYTTTGAGRENSFGGVGQKMSVTELLLRSAGDPSFIFSQSFFSSGRGLEVLQIQDSPEARVPRLQIMPIVNLHTPYSHEGYPKLNGIGLGANMSWTNGGKLGASVSAYPVVYSPSNSFQEVGSYYVGEVRFGDSLVLRGAQYSDTTELSAWQNLGDYNFTIGSYSWAKGYANGFNVLDLSLSGPLWNDNYSFGINYSSTDSQLSSLQGSSAGISIQGEGLKFSLEHDFQTSGTTANIGYYMTW